MKTESKEYPKILRSRKEKAIFFPDEIEEFQKENEGVIETFYRYNLVRLSDIGQQIADCNKFKKENYVELRKYKYGSWEKQHELMQEQGFAAWRSFCAHVKIEFPKV